MEAQAWIDAVRVKEGVKRYSADQLRADMALVFSRCSFKGGIGLKTVDEADLRKGPIRESPHRDDIVGELLSTVVERHEISGVGGGLAIRRTAEEAAKFFAVNNVFTGPLQLAFERLLARIGLEDG